MTVKNRTHSERHALLAAALGALLFPAPAHAANKTFTGSFANWSIPNNWTPNGIPFSGDFVSFNPLATTFVNNLFTYDGNYAPPSGPLGVVTLDSHYTGTPAALTIQQTLSTANLYATTLTIANAGRLNYQQSAGTNSASTSFYLGSQSGSLGSYSLAGTASLLSPTEYIGYSGAGTLSQSAGSNTVSSLLSIGATAGGAGAYSLSGTAYLYAGSENIGLAGNPTPASFLQTGGTHAISGNLSLNNASYTLSTSNDASLTTENTETLDNATFSQSAGYNTADFLNLTTTLSSSASYLLSAGHLQAREINVASAGTASFIQTGGIAYSSTANLEVYVGSSAGSTGFYSLSGTNTLLDTAFTTVGGGSFGGSGTFVQTSGSHAASVFLTVDGPASIYSLSGTGYLTAPNLTVGYTTVGSFLQTGGSSIVSNGLQVGDQPNSSGSYTLSGGTLVGGAEFIGEFGAGSFTQSGGIHFIVSDLYLGLVSGSSGSYHLSAGTLTLIGSLHVGGDILYPGGAATFSQTGGTASINGSVYIFPGSSFSLSYPAKLTLASNPLIWNYSASSPIDTLRSYLHLALLTSSSLTPTTALAYSDDGSSVITQIALLGDANLDGKLNAGDYALLDRSFNKHLPDPHWTDGDFNYDGVVDQNDYLLIDRALYQAQGFSPGFLSQRESQFGPTYVTELLTSLPEPSLFAACGLALPLLRRRCRILR
jgi:hypothetical protein